MSEQSDCRGLRAQSMSDPWGEKLERLNLTRGHYHNDDYLVPVRQSRFRENEQGGDAVGHVQGGWRPRIGPRQARV